MAKELFLLKPQISNDAEYRLFGLAISGKFAAAGFIKSTDTGQVDWATVTKPTGANQNPHYEIWQMNDSLQATKPVFVKVLFGTSESYADMFSIYVQVATSTDGAGNLTGKISMQRRFSAYTNSYNTLAFQNYFTGGEANRIGLFLFVNSDFVGQNAYNGGFVIERTKDSAGVANGEGVAFFAWHYQIYSGAQYHSNQMLIFTDPIWSEFNSEPACINVLQSNQNSTFMLGKVAAFPIYPARFGGLLYNPILSIMACLDRDFVNDVVTLVDFYGTPRSFLKVGYGAAMFSYSLLGTQNRRPQTRALILWED